MKNRKEQKTEILCKESFTAFLKENICADDIHWEIVQNDPPDYYLTLYRNKSFAVEVTESRVYRQSLIDKNQVLEKEYREYHKRFIKQIENEAKKNNYLKGTYIISFKYPVFRQKYYKKQLSKIKEKYDQYIKEAYNSESAGKMDFNYRGIWISAIEKTKSDKDSIYPYLGTRIAFIDSPENIEIVKSALQQAIYDKKEKLERNTIIDDKILLFYDSYLLDERFTYSFSYNSLEYIDYFHTVFIYLPSDSGGFIYYSKDPEVFRKRENANN